MPQGTVKWFNSKRATVSSPRTTAAPMCSSTTPPSLQRLPRLEENQRVEFTAGRGPKGPQAEEVHPL